MNATATVKQIIIGTTSAVLAAFVLNWLNNRKPPQADAPPPAESNNKHWWEW